MPVVVFPHCSLGRYPLKTRTSRLSQAFGTKFAVVRRDGHRARSDLALLVCRGDDATWWRVGAELDQLEPERADLLEDAVEGGLIGQCAAEKLTESS